MTDPTLLHQIEIEMEELEREFLARIRLLQRRLKIATGKVKPRGTVHQFSTDREKELFEWE